MSTKTLKKWECPECGKKLKRPGTHMQKHQPEPDFEIIQEDRIDDGKMAITLTVEERDENVDSVITFSFDEECACKDSISLDCSVQDHLNLLICPYCSAGTTLLYSTRPSIQEQRCMICGKVYIINVVEKNIVWMN
tara:strand:- start:1055 stop:1462 length:408 start_codon:yes stop_codon:yes gene_type:complete